MADRWLLVNSCFFSLLPVFPSSIAILHESLPLRTLLSGIATVNGEPCACNPRSLIAGQENGETGNVFRLSEPSHRMHGNPLLARIGIHAECGYHLGFHDSRTDAIHADFLCGVIQSHG